MAFGRGNWLEGVNTFIGLSGSKCETTTIKTIMVTTKLLLLLLITIIIIGHTDNNKALSTHLSTE
jgi:hypothetical protein